MRKHTLAAGCWPLGRACLSRCLSRCLAPAVGFYGGLGARCQYKVGGVAAYSRGLCTKMHTAGAARTWHVHVASACCVHAVLTDRHGTHVPCAPGPRNGEQGRGAALRQGFVWAALCAAHQGSSAETLFLLSSLQSECCLQGECVESERDSAAAQAWVVRAPMCFDHQCGFASERGLQLALTRFVPC